MKLSTEYIRSVSSRDSVGGVVVDFAIRRMTEFLASWMNQWCYIQICKPCKRETPIMRQAWSHLF
jgi:hypothetical protein